MIARALIALVFVASAMAQDPYLLWTPEHRVPQDANPATYFRNISQHFLVANDEPSLMYDSLGNRLPQYDEPGGPASIDILNAWKIQNHAKDIVVAILDTGIDGTHPDLQANIVPWTAAGNLTDYDRVGHGTMVAGIIGAIGGNSNGVSGICRQVRLWPVRTTFGAPETSALISNVVQYSSAHNYRTIINMSYGFESPAAEPLGVRNALMYANSNNVLVVAVGLNGSGNQDAVTDYPASWHLPNVIMVGGHTRNDQVYGFTGTNIHLLAGARLVVTTAKRQTVSTPLGPYTMTNCYTGGTSAAGPQVAAVAALCWQRFPDETHVQIKERILKGVVKHPNYVGACSSEGRLNAYRSLIWARTNQMSISTNGVFAAGPENTVAIIEASCNLVAWATSSQITNDGFPKFVAPIGTNTTFFRMRTP